MGFRFVGPSLVDLMDHVRDETMTAGHRMAEAGLNNLEANITKNTPVETHALRNSYQQTGVTRKRRAQVAWAGWVWTGEVWTEIEYAEFVERGTGLWGPKRKKYKIEPKKPGGVLAFTPYARTSKGGVILNVEGRPTRSGAKVVVRYVMHPGSPGAHMFQIGAVLTEHEIESWSADVLRRWERDVESFR